MLVMKIDNAFKLVVFGGESEENNGLLDSFEIWDTQTETWKVSKLTLQDKVSRFSTITIFNRLSAKPIGVQANNILPVLENNPNPLVVSFNPVAFPQTEEEHCNWYFNMVY